MPEITPSDGLRIIVCFRFDPRAPVDEVAALKQWLIDDGRTRHSVEVSGAFDFMIEIAISDFASYQDWSQERAESFARLVSRQESNFVCRRFVKDRPAYKHHLWTSSPDGMRRVECDLIDRICAEGDYVRVHSADNSWLLHTSLSKLVEDLDPAEFIRLHRSIVVRISSIIRLIHRGRVWFALLEGGRIQRIAKSHVAEVLHTLRDDSSITHAASATGVPLAEKPVILIEDRVQ